MYEVGYVFSKDEYKAVAMYCMQNNLYITRYDKEKKLYQIQAPPEPSPKQIAENEINRLKRMLAETDYKAIKYAEGELSADEYAPTKQQRIEWRAKINELQAQYGL